MDLPPGGTKVLRQPQVQLWVDRAQSPVKGIMSQHQFYPIKICLGKSVSGHLDAERQQCFTVFGVVQHLNVRLKRQIRQDKGHGKVPRSKQTEAVGLRNVSGEHHLKSPAQLVLKKISSPRLRIGIMAAVWGMVSSLRQSGSETARLTTLQRAH